MSSHRSQWAYTALLALVGVERLAELRVASRNARASFAAGGVEHGKEHYPVMVVLHSAFLAGCLAETWVRRPAFRPVVGWPALAGVVGAQALRWWCIRTLGPQWNTRVIVVPGAALVQRGLYRYVPHPNYVAVVVEGVALPLVHSAWITAGAFTGANALLLRERIRVENQALGRA